MTTAAPSWSTRSTRPARSTRPTPAERSATPASDRADYARARSDIDALGDGTLSVSEMAGLSGLSTDTLRWYEKEGIIPPVERAGDGTRRYDRRTAGMVLLMARLRATGMPTAEMKEFSHLVAAGAATHTQRIDVLQRHRQRIRAQQAELRETLRAVDEKIAHYRALIDAGLDCLGAPLESGRR